MSKFILPNPNYRLPSRAARTVEPLDGSSESEEEDEIVPTSGDSDSESVLTDPKDDSDIEMDELDTSDDGPEIILLDAPQRHSLGPEAGSVILEPPIELVQAVKKLSLPIIRMQKARQLPFLLRNIKRGFHSRCSMLQVPIFTDSRESRLSVRYEDVAGEMYHVHILAWSCPLCTLLRNIKTREMLDCHLRWDHAEVFCEWQLGVQTEVSNNLEIRNALLTSLPLQTVDSWELRILIPEIRFGFPN